MGYSNLLAEDKRLVTYRPRLNEVTGSVTATVLLQQIIFHADNVGNRPFYKFRAPCRHRLYKEGDSWTEELGFSPAEFDTARSKIATRVKKGDSKTEALKGETANHLVIYWTDASRVTWYMLNVDLLNRILEKLYADSRNSNYQSEESPNSESQDSGNTRKLGEQELPLSETTTEITPEKTAEKTQAIFPEKSDSDFPDSPAPPAPSPGGGDAVLGKELDHDEKVDTSHVARNSGRSRRLGDSQVAPLDPPDSSSGERVGVGNRIGADSIGADPIVESIADDFLNKPSPEDLARATAAARAKAGGNWADAGEDRLAAAAITCLFKGKPPRRDSGTWHDMVNVLKPIHADWGLHDMEVDEALAVVRAAIALFLDEKPQMAIYKYPSFNANYGQYLSRAMNGDRRQTPHRNDPAKYDEATRMTLERLNHGNR